MNNKLNFLLRTALSAATEDRESFIEKFSAVLEDYTGLDKQTGAKAGKRVASGLSALKEELETAAMNQRNNGKMEELSAQLAQINERLDEIVRELNNRKA